MDQFFVTVSTDGMISLPPDILAHFGDRAVICLGKDNSIALYTADQWEDFLARLRALSPAAHSALRAIVATAVQADLTDGCLTLPPQLRAYADITSAARIEWDAQQCRLFRAEPQ